MKITHEDLKKAYKSHVQSCVPQSREDCPSVETILQIFEKSFPSMKKEEVIDHIVKCAHCFQEFEYFLSFIRDETEMAQEVAVFLKGKKGKKIPKPEKRHKGAMIFRLPFHNLPAWKRAAVSMAVLIIAGLSLILIKPGLRPPAEGERGEAQGQVKLLYPVQGQSITLPLLFRWQELKKVESYELEVFDSSLQLLWRSPRLRDHFYELPREVAEKVDQYKVYFWMVTAFLPDGIKKESALERFILTKSPSIGYRFN